MTDNSIVSDTLYHWYIANFYQSIYVHKPIVCLNPICLFRLPYLGQSIILIFGIDLNNMYCKYWTANKCTQDFGLKFIKLFLLLLSTYLVDRYSVWLSSIKTTQLDISYGLYILLLCPANWKKILIHLHIVIIG